MKNPSIPALHDEPEHAEGGVSRRPPPDRLHRRVILEMPAVRSVSLAVIATILTLYALQWAKDILILIFLGILLSYALCPIVDKMQKYGVPRIIGATILLSAILIGTGSGAWVLSDQTDALVETLPKVTQKIRQLLQPVEGETSTIQKVEQAATELATAADAPPVTPANTARVVKSGTASQVTVNTNPPVHIDIRGFLLSGTVRMLTFLGQLAVVFFMALFLLAAGNSFRRKLVKLAGPKLSQKKITVETLDEISEHIQRFLLVQVGVSIIVGIATWLVFWALGLKQSAVWGVVAAVTNMIPYVGSLVVSLGAATVALVQFDTPGMAVLVGASSFAIHAVIGNVLTPYWMGKASQMSPVAVFVAVLVFGWLWGVAGLLLGVPILLILKSICDRVEDLAPVGELIGD